MNLIDIKQADLIKSVDFASRWGKLRSYAASQPLKINRDLWGELQQYSYKVFLPELAAVDYYLICNGDADLSLEFREYIEQLHEQANLADNYLFEALGNRYVRLNELEAWCQRSSEEGGNLRKLGPSAFYRLMLRTEVSFEAGAYLQWGHRFLTKDNPTREMSLQKYPTFTKFTGILKPWVLLGDLVEFNYSEFYLRLIRHPMIVT